MEKRIENKKIAPALRKVLSLLLSLVMLFSITAGIDLSAYAETVVSGFCGDNLEWSIDENGVLFIDGVGNMDDFGGYNSSNSPLWYDSKDLIEEVVIGSGVTSIGNYAFKDCENIARITIPNTVTRIGGDIFINFVDANSGYNLEVAVFYNDTIENWRHISIDNDEYSDMAAFTRFCTIHCVDGDIIAGVFNDNVEFEYQILKDGTAEITAYIGSETDISIPSKIDGYTVTSIGNNAFYECWSLKKVIIPDGVTSIGQRAFYKCSCLTSIDIPDSVSSIGSSAFYSCESLTNIRIPDGVTMINSGTFYNCESLTNIIIPDSVTSIGYNAFKFCEKLNSIKLSDNVISIDDDAFGYCKSLTSITIPDSVTSIGQWTFSYCYSLIDISIPNGVLFIDDSTFFNCESLKSITITNSIKRINSSAFGLCDSLSDVYYDGTIDEWNDISLGDNNERLTQSTIYCSDSIINCNHRYSIIEVIKQETCTEDGKTKFTCEFCGKIEYETYLAEGHSYDDGIITKPVTCTSNGIKTYTCTVCKATRTETIHTGGHKTVRDKAVAATCTTAGKTEGLHCSVCNTVITAQKTVPATGHSFEELELEPPTATTKGIKTYLCSKCDEIKTEIIPALGLKTPTLKAAVNANGSFTLSWNKVSEAENYELYIKNADGSYKLMKTATDASTKFIIATAAYGKAYSYKIRAIAGNVKSDFSNVVNVTNNKKLQTPTMKATVNANGTFKLSWNAVSGATAYELYIKQSDGSYKLMKTTTATSFTTAFATYGKQFSYTMRAVTSKNKSAASAYSSAVNATNNKKLQTPTMKATVNANGTFKLSWNAVSGATAYELYIKQADGSYKLMKTTTATSFTTAFATYGKQFSYKMRAVTSKNKSAASAYSSVVNAKNTKKLQTPTLKVTVNTNGTFKLSWNKVTGAEKYELYIKQANGSYKLMKTTTSTSFTTAFATYGKQFSYKMRAVKGNTKSAYSSVVNAKNTKKLQTPSLKVAVNKNGSFKLSWGKVTGATSYQIYMKQSNGTYKLIKTTSSTSFTTAVASKGKTYSYKVRAVTSKNKNATSNYSKVVSAKRK